VTRETPLNKEGIKLAELGPGDSFGEEALIAEAKTQCHRDHVHRGHASCGSARLTFRPCSTSLCLQWVDQDRAKEIVAAGGKWLDVRLPVNSRTSASTARSTIPLYFIRLKLNCLDKNTQYVVCCDTGLPQLRRWPTS